MRIFSLNPCPPGASAVATFNVALDDDVRIFNARLHRKQDGTYRVYAPQAGGVRVVTFSQPLVDKITDAALAALMELCANDRTAA
ncbi:hypothetical protein ASD64_15765 [Mesorhizobium sp. Root157]|uniref:hypothetical protein n=1 Tax=Mesorhizobium sp. Root157 TaxID=1736477 RepID=UPI0006FBB26B|nr:hypothetical protein [Mesorhizobium sp. Root157]KQZ98435.1 hypothetical protein ASD64_15765 [Mesorhizobium sp. Root157]